MIVTLTTDFGLADGYVAAMKGAMMRVAPGLTLVDVSHSVEPQDVMGAAFVLAQATPFLPDGAVHLVVVDPGVGTDRRGIAARIRRPDGETCTFVGPDNGIASLLASDPTAGGEVIEIVALDRPEAWGCPAPSATFHGRDIFGPVAARLALGAPLASVGSPVDALTPLHWPLPITDDQGIGGMVLHVDRYGNCLTNISRESVERLNDGRTVTLYVGSAVIRGMTETFGSVAFGEPAAIYGSGGHLEIVVNGGNAATLLSLHRGAAVTLVFGSPLATPARSCLPRPRALVPQPRTLA
ncbi:MAG TPA: SAM-dependent chlorinase/fluorinase [Rubricoccaceae bacterium]